MRGPVGRQEPVRDRAAAVHAAARRGRLGLLVRRRGQWPRPAAEFRRLRGHGLRGSHDLRRGAGEPQPQGDEPRPQDHKTHA